MTKMQESTGGLTVEITTYVVTGISGSASVILGVDEGHVYALATS